MKRPALRAPLWKAALGVLLAAAACGGGPSEPEDNVCKAALEIRATIPGGTEFLTLEQEADIAARVLPGGFGGLYQDLDKGRLVFTLKDFSKVSAALGPLRQLLDCKGAYPGWNGTLLNSLSLEPRQGQYTGTELLSYLNALAALRTDSGVWAIEVDPEINRIWVGLESENEHPRIAHAVASASVPAGAVMLEVPAPSLPSPAFEVLKSTSIVTEEFPGILGVFGFFVHVRYTNRSSETRYPDQCLSIDPTSFYPYFHLSISKWTGSDWVQVQAPLCVAALLSPRAVDPGQEQTDSIPVTGARRLNSRPIWGSARVTGTYRFEGLVYVSPPIEPPFTNPVPLSERVSGPFRIVRQ